jgi:hypothetical protein
MKFLGHIGAALSAYVRSISGECLSNGISPKRIIPHYYANVKAISPNPVTDTNLANHDDDR